MTCNVLMGTLHPTHSLTSNLATVDFSWCRDGCGFDSRSLRNDHTPRASVTKQYNLVPAERQWFSATDRTGNFDPRLAHLFSEY